MNQLQRYLCTAALALAVAACGGGNGTSNQTQGDHTAIGVQTENAGDLLLIPGQSVGSVALGDADSVLDALGDPDFSDAAMGKAALIWYPEDEPNHPISVFTARDMGNDETARIKQIRITSPRFKTRHSIGVGSSLRDISDNYPLQIVETYDQDGETHTVYNANEGIAFEVDTAYRCVAVVIHEPDVSIASYAPLRPEPASKP